MPVDDDQAVWVHGHGGSLQTTTGFSVERLGYFLRLKGDGEHSVWVHYSVPLAVGTGRWCVADILVQMRTWGGGAITRVDLWDGSLRIGTAQPALQSRVGVQLREGSTDEPLAVMSTGISTTSPISAGVGVSLLVVAERARDAIAIASVGVVLRRPDS